MQDSVRSWVERFLVSRKAQDLSRSTLTADRWVLERLTRWMMRQRWGFAQLTPARMGRFVDELRRRPGQGGAAQLAPSTIQSRLRTLRAWFRYLIDEEQLLFDPLAGFREKAPRRWMRRGIFSVGEIERIFAELSAEDALSLRERAIVAVLYGGGLRLGEALHLDFCHYDPAGTLWIRSAKGRKDRVVPLGPVACQDLDRYLVKGRPELAHRTSGAALFLNRGGTRLGQQGFRMRLYRIEREARIQPRRPPHAFRHSCAAHLLQEGASSRHIQEILGHQDLTMTARYTPVDLDQVRAIVTRCHPRETDPW